MYKYRCHYLIVGFLLQFICFFIWKVFLSPVLCKNQIFLNIVHQQFGSSIECLSEVGQQVVFGSNVGPSFFSNLLVTTRSHYWKSVTNCQYAMVIFFCIPCKIRMKIWYSAFVSVSEPYCIQNSKFVWKISCKIWLCLLPWYPCPILKKKSSWLPLFKKTELIIFLGNHIIKNIQKYTVACEATGRLATKAELNMVMIFMDIFICTEN